jgi:hypothetical protein
MSFKKKHRNFFVQTPESLDSSVSLSCSIINVPISQNVAPSLQSSSPLIAKKRKRGSCGTESPRKKMPEMPSPHKNHPLGELALVVSSFSKGPANRAPYALSLQNQILSPTQTKRGPCGRGMLTCLAKQSQLAQRKKVGPSPSLSSSGCGTQLRMRGEGAEGEREGEGEGEGKSEKGIGK